MKSLGKTEKVQKVRQNDLFSGLAKKKFLYESEKKFVGKTPFYEVYIFETGNFFDKKLKINDEAAEKALNNKEALCMRTPFHRIKLKPYSNNSIDLTVLRVICYSRRNTSDEKPEPYNRPFNTKHTTRNIFCGKKF